MVKAARRVIAPAASASSPRRFALWRLALWLTLLLSAFGVLQYVQHARLIAAQLPALGRAGQAVHAALQGMLVWDIGYGVAAIVVMVLSAAGILRQGWSRVPLRVAMGLLALWMLISGFLLLREWRALAALPPDVAAGSQQLALMRRGIELTLCFKVLAALLSGWLAWRLGVASVRAQFRVRVGGR